MSSHERVVEDQFDRNNMRIVRVCCTVTIIAGIWLFVSPWVYGSEHVVNSWNSWVIGGLIIACMWRRLAFPASMAVLSWFTACLGTYIFASPWLYSYIDDTGRWVNCMLLGIAIILSSIIGGAATKGTLDRSAPARQI